MLLIFSSILVSIEFLKGGYVFGPFHIGSFEKEAN